MKVNADSLTQTNASPGSPKMSKDDIAAKVRAKFGAVAQVKKAQPVEDKVEIHSKGVKNSDEEDFGDVKKNRPDAEVTQEKLKSILSNGGFEFNEKERNALSQILN